MALTRKRNAYFGISGKAKKRQTQYTQKIKHIKTQVNENWNSTFK